MNIATRNKTPRKARKLFPPLLATLGFAALAACSKAPVPTAVAELGGPAAEPPKAIAFSAELRATASLETATADAGAIRETVPLYGSVSIAADRVHKVAARFPGIAGRVSKQPGDAVRAGELLLTVESNDSLEPYRILAPASGRVLERHVNAGETLGSETLFVIGDLGTVWAELTLFPRDAQKLKLGQKIEVRADGQPDAQAATISFIGPAADLQRKSLVARVQLDNRDGRWTPGQLVAATAITAERAAALVVPLSAIQNVDGGEVVFVETADGFLPRALKLGARDPQSVEVLEGLQAGERIVIRNSYLLKAEWLSREGG